MVAMAPIEDKNKQRIEYRVNHHRSNRRIHRFLRVTGRTKHSIQPQIKMGNDITQQNHFHIVAGITDSSLTSAKEIENRVEK